MVFQPRARTPRDFGRRPEKARPKAKSEKRRPSGSYRLESEEHVPTSKEVVDRTFNSLNHLGSQRFAVAPFYDHFDRWLLSLRTILSEFESSHLVTSDDQFAKESSQVLSDIELGLKERRFKEASREEAIRRVNQSLLEAKSLLAQTEREYSARAKQIANQKELAAKPMVSQVGKLREELNRIVQIRTGFLRGISKKAKAQKTTEATRRLDSTRSELAKIEQSFVTEQDRLQEEYKKRKRQLLGQIAGHQKELQNLEAGSRIDDALDIRRNACNALINAVNALLQRTELSQENNSSPS